MRFDLSYLMALIAIGSLPAMATPSSDQDDALAQRDIQTGAVLEGSVPVAKAKRSPVNMAAYSDFLAKHGPHGSETGRKPKVAARSPEPAKGKPPGIEVPPKQGFSGTGQPRAPGGKPKPVTKRPPKIEIPGRKKPDPKYKAHAPAPIGVPAREPKVAARFYKPLGKRPPRGTPSAGRRGDYF